MPVRPQQARPRVSQVGSVQEEPVVTAGQVAHPVIQACLEVPAFQVPSSLLGPAPSPPSAPTARLVPPGYLVALQSAESPRFEIYMTRVHTGYKQGAAVGVARGGPQC